MAPTVSTASSSPSNATSVQVAVRIRPPTTHDAASIPSRFQRTVIHASSPTNVTVDNVSSAPPGTAGTVVPPLAPSASSNAKKSVFAFDQVHAPETTQFELYNTTASPLVSRFIEGFNCTILAYGQTSSGKTYSMTGIDLDANPSDPTNGMGIIPRAVSTIFSNANDLKRTRGSSWHWSIKASFIEIYNEDLIDLLAVEDAGGARRDVQIREDKDGNIIWGGLREIPVRSAADVMALLIRGTALRRTNETDMNAQSSRSHAIFSITLTQKKFSGSSSPPRTGRSSPMPSNGSPSRLIRPGSMHAGSPATRVSSPTFGRSPTPSFATAMSRANGNNMRPASSLGMRPRSPEVEDGKGDWTTVVSKFHFVDLAGSERLKRTAAAGDRIKEGISINGGLLALGNVISALGDPSRARTLGHGTPIHVPYRDSKLTRLLQDSLGGNAHTLMIACVSPAEWNLGETINTLKYANRARNIKNRAEIREKEDGWDDLEWLQSMVTKLRKELKALKEGGVSSLPTDIAEEETPNQGSNMAPERAGGKVLKQYGELQSMYRELRKEYVERNEELARLRRELEDRTAPSAPGGGARYEEIVGPVIEEYEKTITAMEAELKLSRTALEHTNEMYAEQENELVVYKERNANADGYIEALRSRVSKLLEREASTESYIRDLEAKLKAFAESSTSTDDSVADLRKEILRHKEAEASSSTYIAALEHRLTRADTDMSELHAQIEKLEIDLEQKNEVLDTLQGRLDVFLREQDDARNWKKTLDEREKRVQELELKMQEWEQVRRETSEERERLGDVVQGVTKARRSLEVEGTKKRSASLPKIRLGDTTPTSSSFSPTTVKPDTSSECTGEDEFLALQKTHSDTLAQLESVTSKYRDALREIADLAAQISEAKLQSDTSSEVGSDTGSSRLPPRTPRRGISRRETVDGLTSLKIPPSPISVAAAPPRRSLFRHAASSEGLHSRSQSQSQSLSQELYSPPYSRTSWALGDSLLSPGSLPSKGFLKREFPQDNVRSAESLEKEIHRLQEALNDRESEISMLEKSLAASAPEYFPSAPPPASNSPLPDVKEESDPPDSKHTQLLDQQQREAERKEAESITRLDELMRSMAQKESQHVAIVDHLNDELENLRKQHEDLVAVSRDQAEEHSKVTVKLSTDLEQLRSNLSASEETQRELSDRLRTVQVREAELLEARRIADEAHAKEISELLTAHAIEAQRYDDESAAMLSRHRAELEAMKSGHADVERIHAETHKQSIAELTAVIDRMNEAHAGEISNFKSEQESLWQGKLDEANTVLESARSIHEQSLAAALAEREEALRRHTEQAEQALNRLRGDHAAELRRADIAREGTLTESQSRQAAILQELQAEHQAMLERAEAALKADIDRAEAEHRRLIAAQEEEHLSAITKLQSEHTQHTSEHQAALEAVRADHSRTLVAREAEFLVSIEKLSSEHAAELDHLNSSKSDEIQRVTEALVRSQEGHQASLSALRSKMDAALDAAANHHQAAMQVLRSEHDAALARLTEEREASITELQTTHSAAEEDLRQAIGSLRQEHEARLEEERQQQTSALTELDEIHNEERETLRKAHDLLEDEVIGLKAAAAKSTSDFARLRLDHEGLRAEKDQTVLSLTRELASAKQQHSSFEQTIQDLHNELEAARGEKAALAQEVSKRESLASELDHHRTVLSETQTHLQRTKEEMDNLRQEKNRQDQVLRELQAQLAAAKSQRSSQEDATPPQGERAQSHRIGSFPPAKLPPLTPPPSIPPPPVPGSVPPMPSLLTDSSISAVSRSSRGSHESLEDSNSVRSTPSTSILLHSNGIESKLQSQFVEQNRLVEEQETMIKTLNKQLTHCESDLQAHMDLVATLETSLTDSERNLRKTRMQANEYAKERDTLNAQIESLRSQLQASQQEIVSVRRSVVEEKQSFESRLEEERRQKERTRAQLDGRMEELQRRKSKYVCL